MQPTVVFLTVLLVGVNSQIALEDIFNMNMGIPNLQTDTCPDDNPQCSSNNDIMGENIFDLNMGTPTTLKPDSSPDSQGSSSLKAAGESTTAAKESVPRCGYRNVNGVGSFSTAMDGSEAHFGEFPWVVAVLRTQEAHGVILEMYTCTGSLIHPRVVLTAAHRVSTGKSRDYKVRAGEWDPHDKSEELPHQDRQVSYRIIHPRYNVRKLWFDITLLILEQPFDLMPNIDTICLAPSEQLVESSPCYVSGWGIRADTKDPPNVLKKVDMTVKPAQQCERDLRAALGPRSIYFTWHNSYMCAGGDLNKDSCLGDGGAPLMCPIANTANRYYQAGIVSWGLECGQENVPGIYTNLSYVRPWIDEQLTRIRINTTFYIAQ